jgi:hypothetical protein
MTAKTYSGKNNAGTKQKQKQGQQQKTRAYGWSDSIHPTLRKCAKDGAPGDEWRSGGEQATATAIQKQKAG